MLRLRKTEQQIAGELCLKPEEACSAIDVVRHRLSREGMLYLVEDPEMVSLRGEAPDDPDIPMPSPGLDIESRLIVKEFVRALRECIETLPPHQTTLLRLRYRNDLTAGEVVDFVGRTGVSVIDGKTSTEVTEQDIYYGINSALVAVLKQLRSKYKGEYGVGIDHLKMIFEEFDV
jgi:hypothetical protein